MNYRRIELIFLIAFLLLNIYLGINLYQDNKAETVNKVETIADIEKILERDRIKYPKKLSNQRVDGYYLSAKKTYLTQDKKTLKQQEVSINNGVITSTLNKKIQPKLNDNFLSAMHQFAVEEHHVIDGDDYRYDEEGSSKKMLVYTQMYKGMPIDDETARIEYYIDNNTVTKYRQAHISDVKAMRDAKQLISERDAIFTLYSEGKLSDNDQIRWLKLTYRCIYKLNDTYVYAPIWQVDIRHNGGLEEVERVNAMTNRIVLNGVPDNENN